LLRQGKGAAAKDLLQSPSAAADLELVNGIVSLEQLTAAATGRRLNDEELQKIVLAEMTLEGVATSTNHLGRFERGSYSAATESWSHAARAGGLAPRMPLELEKLTEFDPAESIYRKDRWVRP